MKKSIKFGMTLLFVGWFGSMVFSQNTNIFHENFEVPGMGDSVVSSQATVGNDDWSISSGLFQSGANSIHCAVTNQTSSTLTTASFSTLNSPTVLLSFGQICKVDFLDLATIWVSVNGGVNWTQLTAAQYMGTGIFGPNGNRFASNSYGTLWAPANPSQVPSNAWWKTEMFNISAIAGNQPDVRVRFKLQDGGTSGGVGNAGWFLDNINITAGGSEIDPPVIVLASPQLNGVVFNLGPFQVKASVSDASGIDTAYVVYTVNGGPDHYAGMVHTVLDTMVGVIPAYNDSDVICFYVKAFDQSGAHNTARNPVNSCQSFTVLLPLPLSSFYFDGFDGFSQWTAQSSGGSIWQMGTPAYGVTTGAHSPPNAWDVNLAAAYASNTLTTLTSPALSFSGIENARLSFWIKYYTEQAYDGVQLQYTTDGINYQILGGYNDPQAVNWYNMPSIYATNQVAWAGSSSQVAGNINGWYKAEYNLSLLNNLTGPVKFRYLFASDDAVQYDGFSLDDFSIQVPLAHDVGVVAVLSPLSVGCGPAIEPVTVRITNFGTNTETFPVSYLSQTGQVSFGTIVSMAPGTTITYTFPVLLNIPTVLTDTVISITVCTGLVADMNTQNDTLVFQLPMHHTPPAPQIATVTIPSGNNALLTVNTADTVKWYDAPVGGNLLWVGNVFATPILFATTVYYPQAVSSFGCLGPRAADTVKVTLNQGGINGVVSYSNFAATAMNNTTVQLFNGAALVAQTTTNNQGYYEFLNLPAGNYQLVALSQKPWGGGNALDGLFILKHFTGIIQLNGLFLEAGDVDGSGFVNANDALLTLQRFTGAIGQFNAGDWHFETANVVVPVNTVVTRNIKALCFGDVNGSYTPPF